MVTVSVNSGAVRDLASARGAIDLEPGAQRSLETGETIRGELHPVEHCDQFRTRVVGLGHSRLWAVAGQGEHEVDVDEVLGLGGLAGAGVCHGPRSWQMRSPRGRSRPAGLEQARYDAQPGEPAESALLAETAVAALAALAVRRRLSHLDLVAVLKSRE